MLTNYATSVLFLINKLKKVLEETQIFHLMNEKDIRRTLEYPRVWAWILKDATAVTPRAYKNPKGAVKWVLNVS